MSEQEKQDRPPESEQPARPTEQSEAAASQPPAQEPGSEAAASQVENATEAAQPPTPPEQQEAGPAPGETPVAEAAQASSESGPEAAAVPPSQTSASGPAPNPPAARRQPPATPAATEAPAVKEEKRPAKAAEPAGPSTAVVVTGREPGTPVVTRRRVLQVGFWGGLGAMVAGAAACGVDMLYPRGVVGFGGTVNVDPGNVPAPGEKIQIPEGRFWLVNLTADQGGPGLLALWWKCPHLGCTVPWRPTFVFPDPATGAPKSGWFRCPCHGSTYTDAGVRVFGPAPRSMDTMTLTIEGGSVSVDTGSITNGGPDNPSRAVRL